MRHTKLVCTVGPATCGSAELEALAIGGMDVARVNMCHGNRYWHCEVIRAVRRLNEKGFVIAIMMDTEGSKINMGDLGGASSAKVEVSFSALPARYEIATAFWIVALRISRSLHRRCPPMRPRAPGLGRHGAGLSMAPAWVVQGSRAGWRWKKR
jgi:hypothetical protein